MSLFCVNCCYLIILPEFSQQKIHLTPEHATEFQAKFLHFTSTFYHSLKLVLKQTTSKVNHENGSKPITMF